MEHEINEVALLLELDELCNQVWRQIKRERWIPSSIPVADALELEDADSSLIERIASKHLQEIIEEELKNFSVFVFFRHLVEPTRYKIEKSYDIGDTEIRISYNPNDGASQAFFITDGHELRADYSSQSGKFKLFPLVYSPYEKKRIIVPKDFIKRRELVVSDLLEQKPIQPYYEGNALILNVKQININNLYQIYTKPA